MYLNQNSGNNPYTNWHLNLRNVLPVRNPWDNTFTWVKILYIRIDVVLESINLRLTSYAGGDHLNGPLPTFLK